MFCCPVHGPLWNIFLFSWPVCLMPHGSLLPCLVVLLSVVTVWIIPEFLNTAISYLLGPQIITYKSILNQRGCGSYKSVGEGTCDSHSRHPETKAQGMIHSLLFWGWGRERSHKGCSVCKLILSSPYYWQGMEWFIDFCLALRTICWCFQTLMQSQETQGNWFQLWIIYYPYLGQNRPF